MKHFNNLSSAINWIESQLKFRPKASLVHVTKAFNDLNINLYHIKKIQVAGTNGKGSVSMYLTKIFTDNGYRVGTFISPYLIKFNERIKLNNKDINDNELLELLEFLYSFNETYYNNYEERLSFFELLTLGQFYYFSQKKVNILIVEVGIGGLLDATNIINYDLSLITNIGLDHMKQLGNTKEEIALNKLGILKKNSTLFTTVDDSLYELFNDYVKNVGAKLEFIKNEDVKIISNNPNSFMFDNFNFQTSLLGSYQPYNAALAIKAAKYIDSSLTNETINNSLKAVKYAGRLEMMAPNIYIDGAHNIDAINSLVDSVNKLFLGKNIYVLFSTLGDKNAKLMLDALKKAGYNITTTSFPDRRYQSLAPYGYNYIEDNETALKYIKGKLKKDDILIITGSLHFIGYIKNHFIKDEQNERK